MKTVFISGASRGIGKATAIKFAREGYNVVIVYNKSKSEAELLKAKLNGFNVGTLIIQADVSDKKSIQNAVDLAKINFHHIDVLVNSAGISQEILFQDVSEKELRNVLDVNLVGTMLTTQAVILDMVNRKMGSIVNLSSMWGLTGASMEVVYSASKAGVIGFTKALAKELAPSNITVNCIAPGAIMTDMISHFDKETLKSISDETPLMRLGTPEEIADAIFFLATHSFITGQVLSVDGGMVI